MIRLEQLTKSFKTQSGRHYVFRDLNFEFPENKNIGILGPNGAGKSTLMRIIAGIDHPDSGRVITNRSISWPVGLVGGLQGSLSARENVKFVCRVHGLHDEVMREKVAYVQDFAEIGKYFDMPINTYSSGMRSRVTFGLSMAFDFDYYLVDEVAAVGDRRFRDKSEAIFNAKKEHANLIVVSHSMGMLKKQCDMGLLVVAGTITTFENIDDAINAYNEL
ncbi:ABC transporter ATP-binding protein [Vogesella indigofera]|uniref:ABC transporter ATP-binding protein n=1 Tax=Vogesella indigofera TaxID=45465 RepID=UPI00234EBD69|nr:ABC transporter ATP-binding protein [Vogesella indigofera]MDC7710852.1 ABC transporter ATP-binding protein [Vogesella indigofera]